MALNSGYLSNSSRPHHHGDVTTTQQTAVGFLGVGEMGSALARAVIRAGHPTNVWNRSPVKATALIDDGARAATTASEAIDAAELIVVCLFDHRSVHEVLDPLAGRLAGRRVLNRAPRPRTAPANYPAGPPTSAPSTSTAASWRHRK